MVTKVTYVGEGFTRKPPKYERFIRPMALRFKKAHVTHPEVGNSPFPPSPPSHTLSLPQPQLKATFQLPIIGVKKNPQSPTFTNLGVITKGTIIEVYTYYTSLLTQWHTHTHAHSHTHMHTQTQVNISELGLVTQSGKVVWGK